MEARLAVAAAIALGAKAQDEAGAGLTVDLADVLVERAKRIRAVVGCS